MKLNTKINIHNRFDVEVRDAISGELKQQAVAYNLVLDKMWTRLCGGNPYFAYIHFGIGAGEVISTRTSLFTHLGTKVAVDEEIIKALPVSKWKRKIVLNPEEYVGQTITEVGIAWSGTTTELVTHALLKDSEGNPISILKTSTDVVTIYATVFITFGTPNADVTYIGLPNGNKLVNYLTGGAAPTGAFSLGQNGADGNSSFFGLASTSIGSTTSATWTSDVANKQRKTNVLRFGTTVGNGNVQEIMFDGVFRKKLPTTDFAGQAYSAVPVGTGNGVNKIFKLNSLNIKSDTLVVKVDGVVINNFTKRIMKSNFCNFASAVNSYELGLYYSSYSNDFYAQVASNHIGSLACYMNQYFMSYSALVKAFDGGWKHLTFPIAVENMSKDFLIMGMSNDGNYVFFGNAVSGDTQLLIYKIVDDVLIKQVVTTDNITGTKCGAISSTGEFIVRLGSAPIYSRRQEDGSYVSAPSLFTSPIKGEYAEFSHDDKFVVAVSYVNPEKVQMFKWNGTNYIPLSIDFSAITQEHYQIYQAKFNHDGSRLAIATSGGIYLYSVVGDVFTLLKTPTNLGSTLNAKQPKFTLDGKYLIWSIASLGGLLCLDLNTYTFIPSGTNATDGYVPITVLEANGRLVLVRSGNRIWTAMFDTKERETEITFDTAPTAGQVITADYTVNGIHKTDQYVIDVSFAIQFGEGV